MSLPWSQEVIQGLTKHEKERNEAAYQLKQYLGADSAYRSFKIRYLMGFGRRRDAITVTVQYERASGAFKFPPDKDGTVRWCPNVVRFYEGFLGMDITEDGDVNYIHRRHEANMVLEEKALREE